VGGEPSFCLFFLFCFLLHVDLTWLSVLWGGDSALPPPCCPCSGTMGSTLGRLPAPALMASHACQSP
jgi:hypothetical protein